MTRLLGFVGLVLGLFVLAVVCFWALWNNALVGAIDGVKQVSILRATGLVALISMLASPFRFRYKRRDATNRLY